MHLVIVDTDQTLPGFRTVRYDSGAPLYLLLRDPRNHVYLLPDTKIKQKLLAAFPFKRFRVVELATLEKHRFDFYVWEWIDTLQQFKERVVF